MFAYQEEHLHHLVIKQAGVENHSVLSVLTPVHESQTASLHEGGCRIPSILCYYNSDCGTSRSTITQHGEKCFPTSSFTSLDRTIKPEVKHFTAMLSGLQSINALSTNNDSKTL